MDGGDAEAFRAAKIFQVVSHDAGAARSHGKFKHHIIASVLQARTPEAEDFLPMALSCQIAEKGERLLRTLAGWQMFGPGQHVPPFRIEGDGKSHLECRIGNRSDQGMARSAPRLCGGNQKRVSIVTGIW